MCGDPEIYLDDAPARINKIKSEENEFWRER